MLNIDLHFIDIHMVIFFLKFWRGHFKRFSLFLQKRPGKVEKPLLLFVIGLEEGIRKESHLEKMFELNFSDSGIFCHKLIYVCFHHGKNDFCLGTQSYKKNGKKWEFLRKVQISHFFTHV